MIESSNVEDGHLNISIRLTPDMDLLKLQSVAL